MNLYGYLNIDITRVKNIKEIVNNEIDSSCNLLDEIEDLEECKSEFISLALGIRTQMNLHNYHFYYLRLLQFQPQHIYLKNLNIHFLKENMI